MPSKGHLHRRHKGSSSPSSGAKYGISQQRLYDANKSLSKRARSTACPSLRFLTIAFISFICSALLLTAFKREKSPLPGSSKLGSSFSRVQLPVEETNSQPYKISTKLLTNQAAYDWAHHLALSELELNLITADNRFQAGQYWDTTWTRDTSYAAEQAASLLYPDVVRTSLMASVETVQIHTKNDGVQSKQVWLQDQCAHFGAWPHLSDSIVGTRGAWSLYRATGDRDFLKWAYVVTKNTLLRAEHEVFDGQLGLFTGCSSFMESCSGYPRKYCDANRGRPGELVAKTKALSTNALYFSAYKIAAYMGRELGVDEGEYITYWDSAEMLRHAIRRHLWLDEKGYYAYFMDENNKLVDNFEGLGEAFVLLDGIERNHNRISSIFANVTMGKNGLPCLWPQFDHTHPTDIFHYYHNGRIWPFVQGYYAMAAAKHGRTDVIAHSLKSLKDLAVEAKTFAEFYDYEDGSFPLDRRRQLWSSTGYLAMIYQGLFGITYDVDGLRFSPNKPVSNFPDDIRLVDFKFRDMILDIVVMGSGSVVTSFAVDGVKREQYKGSYFLESTIRGKHKITIVVIEG